jgi:hypothetical protein
MDWIEVVRQFFWFLWSFFETVIVSLERDFALYHGVDWLGTVLMLSGIYTLTRNRFVGAIILVFSSVTWIKFNLNAEAYFSIVGNLSILGVNLYTIYQEIKARNLSRSHAKAEVEALVEQALRNANYALPASELQELTLPLNLIAEQPELVSATLQDSLQENPEVTYADVEAITEALFILVENKEELSII